MWETWAPVRRDLDLVRYLLSQLQLLSCSIEPKERGGRSFASGCRSNPNPAAD